MVKYVFSEGVAKCIALITLFRHKYDLSRYLLQYQTMRADNVLKSKLLYANITNIRYCSSCDKTQMSYYRIFVLLVNGTRVTISKSPNFDTSLSALHGCPAALAGERSGAASAGVAAQQRNASRSSSGGSRRGSRVQSEGEKQQQVVNKNYLQDLIEAYFYFIALNHPIVGILSI